MQNGAILGNSNVLMCLDIMLQHEGRLLVLKPIDIWIENEMYSVYNDMCRYSYVGYENKL